MTRMIVFEGRFCRVVKAATPAQTNYLIEVPDGADGMGQIRWTLAGTRQTHYAEMLEELGKQIDLEQERANALVRVPKKK